MKQSTNIPRSTLECGVMFFSASAESTSTDKYQVVVDTAKFADSHGFSSIWVPERHFTLLGGLYPNPSVLQAALAMVTERIQLRAGSVVLPLHNPLRVAEEWAMVDNLSGGRVGIAFASGWNPADFTFFPERYATRQDALFDAIPAVHRLWRGEPVTGPSGAGPDLQLSIFPRPIQRELPTWVTAAGNPNTYARVGSVGANLLTHLLDQGTEALAEKIQIYRDAREQSGFDPDAGRVSIMIHTFLDAEAEVAREKARRPFCDFLKLNAGLLKGLAKARGRDSDFSQLSPEDQESFVQFIYDRFVGSRALIGSPESCLDLARSLGDAGVNEILFLLDFGPSYEEILHSLPHLARLKDLCEEERLGPSRFRSHRTVANNEPAEHQDLKSLQARCRQRLTATEFYQGLQHIGIEVPKSLQHVTEVSWREGEALARILVPGSASHDAPAQRATILEAAMQVGLQTLSRDPAAATSRTVYLPAMVRDSDFEIPSGVPLWVHAVRANVSGRDEVPLPIGLRVLDEGGALLGAVQTELVAVDLTPSATAAESSPERWLYRSVWQPTLLEPSSLDAGCWLILGDRGGLGEALERLLVEQNHRCTLLQATEVDRLVDSGGTVTSLEEAIDALSRASDLPFHGIVHLVACDPSRATNTTAESLYSEARRSLASALVAMKTLAKFDGESRKPRLWLCTLGAAPVDGPTPQQTHQRPSLAQAPLWGMGQTFSVEHHGLFGGLVDLDPSRTPQDGASDLTEVLVSDTRENRVGFRNRICHAPRLVPAGQKLQAPPQFQADASYLVTGGLSGIGLVTAEWLVRRGAKHLMLLGRTVPPPRDRWAEIAPADRWATAVAALRDLEARGASVSYAAVDVGDRDSLSDFLATRADSGQPPIRGVFHAAGVLVPKRLTELAWAEVEAGLRAKVTGSWLLHEAFDQKDLDAFVMFSSAPPELGALGQNLGAYNAANAFMDALAHYRSGRGLRGTSIKWGPWSEVGLHTVETSARSNLQRLAEFGLGGISNREGMQLLGHSMAQQEPVMWALAADWPRLSRNDFMIGARPFFSNLTEDNSSAEEARQVMLRQQEFLATLESLPAKVRRQRLVEHVRGLVTGVMGLKTDTVDWRRGLFDMGMDSLMALELKTKLQNDVGISIPATLAFDHPTVDAIAEHLEAKLFSMQVASTSGPPSPTSTRRSKPEQTERNISEDSLDAMDDDQLEAMLLEKLEAL